MPTEPELAWAAGLIDGEGCITIVRRVAHTIKGGRSDQHHVMLGVLMCNRPTVERLRSIFGVGTVSIKKRPATHNEAYYWRIRWNAAIEVIHMIYPYLFTKKAEADVVFEFENVSAKGKGSHWKAFGGCKTTPPDILAKRDELYWKLRDLKPQSVKSRANKDSKWDGIKNSHRHSHVA